ncbi:hypothetical protein PS6_003463 [Mucor atramentarius]
MSKVSVKNDVWTPFQPIDQPQNSQKRKRASAALKDSGNDKLVPNKRSRAKRTATTATTDVAIANSPSSVTITKSVVWIGATLMQRQGDNKEGEEENGSSIKNEEAFSTTAAFSIFYGVNDTRNFTERVSINQDQNIDHVYIMGVIRALEKCEDDSSALSIRTGSKVLPSDQNEEGGKQDEVCQQVKEKIAQRKGVTSIRSAANNEDGYQAAHKLASESLLEASAAAAADDMEIDVFEKDLVESLQVAESNTDVSITTKSCSTKEVKLNDDNTETVVTTTTVVKEETITITSSDADAEQAQQQQQQQTLPPPPSWVATLNLRNLLEILKAPFTRNK